MKEDYFEDNLEDYRTKFMKSMSEEVYQSIGVHSPSTYCTLFKANVRNKEIFFSLDFLEFENSNTSHSDFPGILYNW